MKFFFRASSCIIVLLTLSTTVGAAPITIFLDADTVATGSSLDVSPLLTPAGTITFVGEIRDKGGDPEFDAAGALGDVFDIFNSSSTSTASLSFDFDVIDFSFIYGGNSGVFDITAFDGIGGVVDSFFQASTGSGQPAGPITLSGGGIRSVVWMDPGNSFAPIDNVTIRANPVPEPTSMALFGLTALGMVVMRRRRKAAEKVA